MAWPDTPQNPKATTMYQKTPPPPPGLQEKLSALREAYAAYQEFVVAEPIRAAIEELIAIPEPTKFPANSSFSRKLVKIALDRSVGYDRRADSLQTAFLFSETPQGSSYWFNEVQLLQRLCPLTQEARDILQGWLKDLKAAEHVAVTDKPAHRVTIRGGVAPPVYTIFGDVFNSPNQS